MLYLPKLTHVQVNGTVVYRKKVSLTSARYLLSECLVITCAVNNKFQTEKNCIGPPTINLFKYNQTSANGHLFCSSQQSIHSLLFKTRLQWPPLYNGQLLQSLRWLLWRGSTVDKSGQCFRTPLHADQLHHEC